MGAWKDSLREELVKGGTGPPCPFCKLPRVQRSDYLRCPRCGVNWMKGERLDKDPSLERRANLLRQTEITAPSKEKTHEQNRLRR